MKKIMTYARNHKGVTLVLMSFLLVLLLIFASLAIDISYMYFSKNQLQVAADAAALAGAAKLTGDIDYNAPLSSINVLEQGAARQEAWKFACKNTAARSPVYLVTNGNKPADCGDDPNNLPTPAVLNIENNINGDIIVGNWSRSTRSCPSTNTSENFCPANGSTNFVINAVKVLAGRTETGESYGMGPVSLFLGKIINWSKMSTKAGAISSIRGTLSPIIVNEYWYTDNPAQCKLDPNCAQYPHSFFRQTNVDGSQSLNWDFTNNQGKPLAIAGTNANPNNTSSDKGGFIGLDYRVNSYSDNPSESWFKLSSNGFQSIPATSVDPKVGDWAPYLDFYPHDLPITITEQRILNYDNPTSYPYPFPTSNEPYASIAYITGMSTGQTISQMIDDGNYRQGRYRPGAKIAVLVYDGLRQSTGTTKRATAVGYAGMTIIGYGNNLSDAQNDPFGKNATSVYGFANSPLRECHTAAECEAVLLSLAPDNPKLVK